VANCWDVLNCPEDRKKECPAYQMGRGDKCWILTGTLCRGEKQGTMIEKMANCKKCEFYARANEIKYFGIKGKFALA